MTIDRLHHGAPGAPGPRENTRPADARALGLADDQGCPIDRVLGAMQSLWPSKIIWRLMHAPQRFGGLRRALAPVSAKVLTERLRRLEAQGLVERQAIDSTPAQVEYSLTAYGCELLPIVEAMAQVAERLSGARCPMPPATTAAERSGLGKVRRAPR